MGAGGMMAEFDKGQIAEVENMLAKHWDQKAQPFILSLDRANHASIKAIEAKVDKVDSRFSRFMDKLDWQKEQTDLLDAERKEAAERRDVKMNWNGTKLTILIALAAVILTLLIALGLIPKLKGNAGLVAVDKTSQTAQNGVTEAKEPDSNVTSGGH